MFEPTLVVFAQDFHTEISGQPIASRFLLSLWLQLFHNTSCCCCCWGLNSHWSVLFFGLNYISSFSNRNSVSTFLYSIQVPAAVQDRTALFLSIYDSCSPAELWDSVHQPSLVLNVLLSSLVIADINRFQIVQLRVFGFYWCDLIKLATYLSASLSRFKTPLILQYHSKNIPHHYLFLRTCISFIQMKIIFLFFGTYFYFPLRTVARTQQPKLFPRSLIHPHIHRRWWRQKEPLSVRVDLPWKKNDRNSEHGAVAWLGTKIRVIGSTPRLWRDSSE